MTRYKAHIQHDPLAMVAKLRIVSKDDDTDKQHCVLTHGGENCEPGYEIPVAINPIHTTEFVQAIIDAAWDAGMRPSGHKDEASSITRIEAHLADMRRLVFKEKS